MEVLEKEIFFVSSANLTPNPFPGGPPSPQARTPFPLPQAGEGNSVLRRHRGEGEQSREDCELGRQICRSRTADDF